MRNMNLTDRQKEVLKVIQDYVDNHNYAPTVRELCDILEISSTSTVHNFINQIPRSLSLGIFFSFLFIYALLAKYELIFVKY